MLNVRSCAPTRVDLGGGTLDIDPLYKILRYKATVNFATSLEAVAEVFQSKNNDYALISEDQGVEVRGKYSDICSSTKLPWLSLLFKSIWHENLPPITIKTRAKSPKGAGLGGSSCLGVAICGALERARSLIEPFSFSDEKHFVSFVQDLETDLIRVPTGCQDYWGAMRGGINVIDFLPGKVSVQTYPSSLLPDLNSEVILCYSGESRASAINNWAICKGAFDGEVEIISSLEKIGEQAEKLKGAISSGDWQKSLEASRKEWSLRRSLWPSIVTPKISKLEQAALKEGAYFIRVCGAGGGGVMAVFVPKEKREGVCQALIGCGGQILDSHLSDKGLTVENL